MLHAQSFSKYKVTDRDIKKCMHNDDDNAESPCIEEAISWADKKVVDKDDTLCKKLACQNKDDQVWQKSSTEEKYELVPYCNYAEGATDKECSTYPKLVSTNACKKKSDEDKCEEVVKTDTEKICKSAQNYE